MKQQVLQLSAHIGRLSQPCHTAKITPPHIFVEIAPLLISGAKKVAAVLYNSTKMAAGVTPSVTLSV